MAMVAKATMRAYMADMAKNTHYRVETFSAPICIGYLVSRAYATNRAQLEAMFAREDINFTQWRVLMCLREGTANTCADLSRELAHDKGSMTRLVDQLEGQGLLKRHHDRTDRRVVVLSLTPAGRAAVTRLIPKIVDYYNVLLADFTPQEVKLLTQLLTKLKNVLRAENEREGTPT